MKYSLGIVGLGVMGENLALNFERNGFSVAGFDLDEKKRRNFTDRVGKKNAATASSINELISILDVPRRILMMVPAGKPVDAVINDLQPHLSAGDVLIDGGNTYFADTDRRMKELEPTGILYIGTGVSGGEEGALLGPSIMPGGNPKAWELFKPAFQSIAAKTDDGTPCCEWIGNGGAGHFVKMVHNGIEYGDMQMICEAFLLMERLLGMSTDEMKEVFTEWNKGELNSYLIEITADILGKKDPETGKPMVHVILDKAEQKGTGKWTSQVAFDLGTPAQTIAEAVFARMISALKKERVAASKVLSGPTPIFKGDRKEFVEKIRRALYCSKICSYAQGFQMMRAADEEYHWNINYGTIALLWRAGCIIRAQFLGKIKAAFATQPKLSNLLMDPYFVDAISSGQKAWRTVIAVAAENGIPIAAMMSALSYYDSYRCERLPANLLQAQRDYFGAHTYERIDKEGKFHTKWKEE